MIFSRLDLEFFPMKSVIMYSKQAVRLLRWLNSNLKAQNMLIRERVTAELPGEFVVFLIGMRINQPLQVHQWLRCRA